MKHYHVLSIIGSILIILIISDQPHHSHAVVPSKTNYSPPSETVILEPTDKHTATIVFLPGNSYYGNDEGKNWSTVLQKMRSPYMKVICPTPFTMSKTSPSLKRYNMSWYDRQKLRTDIKELEPPAEYICNLLSEEVRSGIASERIILGGCGEGGVLAIQTLITFPKKLAGLVTFDTHIPEMLRNVMVKQNIPANEDIPIFQVGRGELFKPPHTFTGETLKKISYKVESKLFDYNNQSNPEEEIAHFKKFFQKHIGPVKVP